METNLYSPSNLEDWIIDRYIDHGIFFPSDMECDRIADVFAAEILKSPGPSHVQWDDDFCIIFINDELSEEKARETFFHELCHPIRHIGNQRRIPGTMVELQENQAAHFQLYAALPFHIIEPYLKYHQSDLLIVLADEFRLPGQLVLDRLEQIHRRIMQTKKEQLMQNRLNPRQQTKSYSDETLRIMRQLNQQLSKNQRGIIRA